MISTELRIGNILLANKKLVEVEGVVENGINPIFIDGGPGGFPSYTIEYEFGFDCIEGGEITEEILLNFGFEKIKKYKWFDGSITPNLFKKGEYTIELLMSSSTRWGFGRIGHNNSSIYIHSVSFIHSLQNVFFAVSNEELQLKDKSIIRNYK